MKGIAASDCRGGGKELQSLDSIKGGQKKESWRGLRDYREWLLVSGISNSNWQIVLPPIPHAILSTVRPHLSRSKLTEVLTHTRTRTHTHTHQPTLTLTPCSNVRFKHRLLNLLLLLTGGTVSIHAVLPYLQTLPLQRIASAQAIPQLQPSASRNL